MSSGNVPRNTGFVHARPGFGQGTKAPSLACRRGSFETVASRSPRSKPFRRGTTGSDLTMCWALDFVDSGHYVDFQSGQI